MGLRPIVADQDLLELQCSAWHAAPRQFRTLGEVNPKNRICPNAVLGRPANKARRTSIEARRASIEPFSLV
jgi:hypothetical protein